MAKRKAAAHQLVLRPSDWVPGSRPCGCPSQCYFSVHIEWTVAQQGTHEYVLACFTCARCGSSANRVYELLDWPGKQRLWGYYDSCKAYRQKRRVNREKCLPFAVVERCFEQMWDRKWPSSRLSHPQSIGVDSQHWSREFIGRLLDD